MTSYVAGASPQGVDSRLKENLSGIKSIVLFPAVPLIELWMVTVGGSQNRGCMFFTTCPIVYFACLVVVQWSVLKPERPSVFINNGEVCCAHGLTSTLFYIFIPLSKLLLESDMQQLQTYVALKYGQIVKKKCSYLSSFLTVFLLFNICST